MTDKPRFSLRLDLARLDGHIDVDPTLIPDNLLDQAWNVMSDLVMDIFDKLGEEPTDEEFRARVIEVCYRIAFREMFTLRYMPMWEKADLARLGTRERGCDFYDNMAKIVKHIVAVTLGQKLVYSKQALNECAGHCGSESNS